MELRSLGNRGYTACKLLGTEKQEFCLNVKRLLPGIWQRLLLFPMEGLTGTKLKNARMQLILRFKVDIPVVLLGGPVRAYIDDLKK